MDTRCMSCMNQYDEKFNVCPYCGFMRGTGAAEPHHMAPETILHKKYIVGKVLGFGGFGVTYIGWDAVLNVRVAIKEYLPSEFATRIPGHTEISVYDGQSRELFSSGLQSFVEEAQRLAKFNSVDGIVGIYDAFQENNTAYIVMEYLDGQTLSSYLKETGPIPYENALGIIIPILQTLSVVNSDGIIHRDISPDNIFLTTDGRVKVLDFGSARYATAYNSKSLSVIVKRGYAPPEQYRRHSDQGPWTDNYAVAATLYKMITGVTPDDSMERISADRVAPPSAMGVNIEQGCENALMNALNLNSEYRPQTAAEFIDGLTGGAGRVEEKKKDPSKFPTWLKILIGSVAGIMIVVGVLFATGVLGPGARRLPDGYVLVPEVLKKNKDEAEEILEEQDLSLLIIGKKEHDEDIEKDLICEQNPEAGETAEKKSEIEVKVSGGPKINYAPGTEHYTKETAEKKFNDEDIDVEFKEEYNDEVGKGGIIKQSKKENSEIRKDEKVTLYVSKGKETPDNDTTTITLPDFMGKDFETMRKELLSQGVYLLVEEANYNDDYAKGVIIAQAKTAGTTVQKGDNVYVTISLGKEKVRVPDVTYISKDEAIKKLKELGFEVETKIVANDPLVEDSLVLNQSVASGQLAELGSTIVLDINAARDSGEIEIESAVQNGTVEGSVADSRTEEPIGNAIVAFAKASDPDVTVKSTKTDSSGRYSETLPEGDYIIKISCTDYSSATKNVTVVKDRTETVSQAKLERKATTAAKGSITGKVVDSENNSPVKNVTVYLYKQSDSSSAVDSVKSDSYGSYRFMNLVVGEYVLKFRSDDYNDANQSVTVAKDHTASITTNLVRNDENKPSKVSGYVTNASNGNALSGARIRVRKGSNNKSGSYLSNSATSASDGKYSLTLDAGTYTLEFSKSNFVSSYVTVSLANGRSEEVNQSISPVIREEQLRIVLNWDDSPSDLDAHLVFTSGGTTYDDYFNFKGTNYGDTSNGVTAYLDVDDTDGRGPETITVKKPSATEYTLYVHNYSAYYNSGATPLTASGARVTVIYNNQQIATYEVPTSGTGDKWTVFRIKGNQITPINRISTFSDLGY